jgi:hypothetical protein
MKQLGKIRGLHLLMFIVVFAAVIAVTMLLWNALLPAIFGIAAINYWQSAGLIILSRLLFGGFGKHRHCWGHHGKGFHKMGKMSREEFIVFHDKVKGMSHSERRKFICQRMAGLNDDEEKE